MQNQPNTKDSMAYFRMASTEEGHNHAGHGPGGSFMRSLVQRRMEEQDNDAAMTGGYKVSLFKKVR